MATTLAAPERPYVPNPDLRAPRWFERIPRWAQVGGLLFILVALSAFLRTRYLSGQFWMDEALSTGIASHPLSQIPGVLRHDGSPPLYYVLLHFWIQAFGASESATHWLSLLFGLLTIPAGFWAGNSLVGRRTGLYAATLFAFSPFLTQYAGETRMYELMGLLGILATAAYIHAFVFRRRRYLIMFAVGGGWGMADMGQGDIQQHPDVGIGEPVIGHPPRPANMHHPVDAQQPHGASALGRRVAAVPARFRVPAGD